MHGNQASECIGTRLVSAWNQASECVGTRLVSAWNQASECMGTRLVSAWNQASECMGTRLVSVSGNKVNMFMQKKGSKHKMAAYAALFLVS